MDIIIWSLFWEGAFLYFFIYFKLLVLFLRINDNWWCGSLTVQQWRESDTLLMSETQMPQVNLCILYVWNICAYPHFFLFNFHNHRDVGLLQFYQQSSFIYLTSETVGIVETRFHIFIYITLHGCKTKKKKSTVLYFSVKNVNSTG